jgi:hypothetical protein
MAASSWVNSFVAYGMGVMATLPACMQLLQKPECSFLPSTKRAWSTGAWGMATWWQLRHTGISA